jgi:NAD(P)-dependent dehydrogenase (short-subunit alcohol dehydrogenase family)
MRRPENVPRFAEQEPSGLIPIELDVTDAASIAKAVTRIAHLVGSSGLHGAVHSAGIVVAGPLELLSVEDLRRQLEVNVVGVFELTRALLPLLRVGTGRIVNIGSVSGRIASPYVGPYAISKHALEALTDAFRLELRHCRVSVSLIESGSVQTPIWQKTLDDVTARSQQWPGNLAAIYEEDLAAVRSAVQRISARAGKPETVVRAVVHALTARRPKTRYRVGLDARLGIFLSRFLPDRVRDWLVLHELGLR